MKKETNVKMNAAVENALKGAVQQIVAAAMDAAREEVKAEVLAKIGKNGAGKPATAKPAAPAARRKGPIQLCPAPGCKERAAPVFGMLCTKHKGTAKTTVAKWREARRKKAAK